jgi:hypothetical protein
MVVPTRPRPPGTRPVLVVLAFMSRGLRSPGDSLFAGGGLKCGGA